MKTKETPKTHAVLYDVEVEKNVLGTIITHLGALNDVRDLLCEDCFSDTFHRSVYKAAINLSEKGDPVDVITVADELRRMGVANELTPYHVATLGNSSVGDCVYSARILHEFLSRRRAWEVGQRLIAMAVDLTFDISDVLEETRNKLSNIFDTPASGIVTVCEATERLYTDHILRNLNEDSTLTGAPTGFEQLDELSGGLHPGNLVIVAAETSQGKTSFATSIAVSAARHQHPVAMYSMEMGQTELMARIVACESGISVNKLLYGKLNDVELGLFDTRTPGLLNLPIYFDDKSTSNIDIIISSIRTMVAKHRIEGVVIDYLQILNVNMKGVNKEQQMGEVARRLKNLAKDLGIWIIALSQLNREQSGHMPTLNRLRDSGQIAEASDIVVLLYRPEVYGATYPEPFKEYPVEGTAMVNIAKGRNIGLKSFLLTFESSVTRFGNLPPDFEKKKADDQPF